MEEVKKDQAVDGEFTEEASAPSEETSAKAEVTAEVTIQIMSDGQMSINVNEEIQELNQGQVENITRNVYEQLHEQRIVSQALEVFKSKLSF
jgi:hypothetical protein